MRALSKLNLAEFKAEIATGQTLKLGFVQEQFVRGTVRPRTYVCSEQICYPKNCVCTTKYEMLVDMDMHACGIIPTVCFYTPTTYTQSHQQRKRLFLAISVVSVAANALIRALLFSIAKWSNLNSVVSVHLSAVERIHVAAHVSKRYYDKKTLPFRKII